MIRRDDAFWEGKLRVFLHDPPDKALDVPGHEERATAAIRAVGLVPLREERKLPDASAAAMTRTPVPGLMRGGPGGRLAVVEANDAYFKHPLWGTARRFDLPKPFDPETLKKFATLPPARKFVAVWWHLDREGYFPPARGLPADTRVPDHSVLDHCDLAAALHEGEGVCALVTYKTSSPQSFLLDARKLGDLWGASNFLSHVAAHALKPVVQAYGPTAVLFPALRGNPLAGYYLGRWFGTDLEGAPPDEGSVNFAALPHAFTALVRFEEVGDLFRQIDESVAGFFRSTLEKLAATLLNDGANERFGREADEWVAQLEAALPRRCAVVQFPTQALSQLPFLGELPADLVGRLNTLDELAEMAGIQAPLGGVAHYTRHYHLTEFLAANLLANAPRDAAAAVEVVAGVVEDSKKCTTCFLNRAVVRRGDLNERFPNVLGEDERLCAPCFVKRAFRKLFGRFRATTATELVNAELFGAIRALPRNHSLRVVRRENPQLVLDDFFLDERVERPRGKLLEAFQKHKIDPAEARGQWNERLGRLREDPGVRKYWALLKMDGDDMGKTLRGDALPTADAFVHDSLLDPHHQNYVGDEAARHLRRLQPPLTPTHQVSFSAALTHFASTVVPGVVERHGGRLIYSGGDDVLAAFRVAEAVPAALELHREFARDFHDGQGGQRGADFHLGVGSKATMSGCVVVAYHKQPLVDVLEAATAGEHAAKEAPGKDCLVLTWLKHSGQTERVPVPFGGALEELWGLAERVVAAGLSRAFFHQLAATVDALAWSDKAFLEEAGRVLRRRLDQEGGLARREKDELARQVLGGLGRLLGAYRARNFEEQPAKLVLSALALAFELLYRDARSGEGGGAE
ncbi:MAG: hypothetical protein Kow0069_39350 [Promethearchaeota archaeon]